MQSQRPLNILSNLFCCGINGSKYNPSTEQSILCYYPCIHPFSLHHEKHICLTTTLDFPWFPHPFSVSCRVQIKKFTAQLWQLTTFQFQPLDGMQQIVFQSESKIYTNVSTNKYPSILNRTFQQKSSAIYIHFYQPPHLATLIRQPKLLLIRDIALLSLPTMLLCQHHQFIQRKGLGTLNGQSHLVPSCCLCRWGRLPQHVWTCHRC